MSFLPREFVVPARPPHEAGTDADVWYWARHSELSLGLEAELEAFLRTWLAADWPFRLVTLNGVRTTLAGR